MLNGKLKHGDLVQWQEGGAKQFTCTGRIISEERHSNGTNPHGFFCVRVDDEHYLRACHTAYEMSSHWVNRSTIFNDLRLLEQK